MRIMANAAVRTETVTRGTVGDVLETLKRILGAYLTWRAETAAIAHLTAMSNRQLRDIGLSRSEIPFAVKGGRPCDRFVEDTSEQGLDKEDGRP